MVFSRQLATVTCLPRILAAQAQRCLLSLTETTQDQIRPTNPTCNHVLDEVTVPRSVDDRAIVLRGLELPEGNVDGDTTLALGLELVQHLQN